MYAVQRFVSCLLIPTKTEMQANAVKQFHLTLLSGETTMLELWMCDSATLVLNPLISLL